MTHCVNPEIERNGQLWVDQTRQIQERDLLRHRHSPVELLKVFKAAADVENFLHQNGTQYANCQSDPNVRLIELM